MADLSRDWPVYLGLAFMAIFFGYVIVKTRISEQNQSRDKDGRPKKRP